MENWINIANKEFGITLTEKQVQQFETLRDFLIEENEKYNLTGISDPREIEIKHFLDSLSVLPYMSPETKSLIDIGSGAGFPGLPIAIARPNIKVTCLESTGKKTEFIKRAIEKIGLSNVSIINGRAEEAGMKNVYREYFDVALARAVAGLPTLLEYALPFVQVGGIFIAQKSTSETIENSGNALKELSGTIIKIVPVNIPNLSPRQLVIVEKTKQTPKQYPRVTGIPLKNPL